MLLDGDQFPYRVIGVDSMVPVSAPNADGEKLHQLPGSAQSPIHYLAYPPGVFLDKIIGTIIQNCGIDMHFQRHFENPMAEGLKFMAMQGHGIAWLPQSSVAHEIDVGHLLIHEIQ